MDESSSKSSQQINFKAHNSQPLDWESKIQPLHQAACCPTHTHAHTYKPATEVTVDFRNIRRDNSTGEWNILMP